MIAMRKEHMMRVDFGLILQPGWRALEMPDILTFNRRAIGMLSPAFTTLWTEDHFQKGNSPALEAWTLLSFMAAEFPLYRLGNIVLCQSYRNPAHLAKMSATLQYLSAGRLILGIGAGWQEDEYRAYGYDFPSAGVRIAQLAETIELVRAMWTQSPASYRGRHYSVDSAYCEPQPDPLPPIMVGADGEKMLRLVARQADGWNTGLDVETYRQRYDLLRRSCDEVGRDVNTIARSLYLHAYFPDDPAEYARRRQDMGKVLLLGPGPADAIAQLRPYVRVGVSHFAVKPHTLATVEGLVAQVAPELTQA
jgi:alkanesulfonate monooxygenase SsuD/methylene tetrahydromethanopterin reductase-like flavin-dependent oxidoreductase (luciferase family)